MRIALCLKKDLHGLIALRHLAPHLAGHEVSIFCSVKTRPAEGQVAHLKLLKLLERDVAIDALAAEQSGAPAGLAPPDRWQALTDLRPEGGAARLLAAAPDLVIAARFSLIFPPAVIAAIPHGIINIHPGALPGYRGLFAPFWQLCRGETVLRCTAHLIDRGIDTGPVIGVARLPLDRRRSLLWHTARLYREGAAIAGAAAAAMLRGEAPAAAAQPAGGAYFRLPDGADFAALPIPLVTAADYAEALAEAFGTAAMPLGDAA